MNNLYIIFAYYMYLRVKAYRELNLVRALDEDTGVFSFSSSLPGQTAVSENSTFINVLTCTCLSTGNGTYPSIQLTIY